MDKMCECCGEKFYADTDSEVCNDCREQLGLFSGDHNLPHPDETDEEFYDHE